MTTRVDHRVVYPGARLDQVVAMVRDPSFREAVADAQHVVDRSVSVSPGEPTRITLELAHGTEKVPAFAKKLVGEQIPIRQEETWTSETAADILVTIPGKPGEMTGTARIEEHGGEVVESFHLEVAVRVPLVGGKVEALIADLLVKAFRAENRVGVKWLGGDWKP